MLRSGFKKDYRFNGWVGKVCTRSFTNDLFSKNSQNSNQKLAETFEIFTNPKWCLKQILMKIEKVFQMENFPNIYENLLNYFKVLFRNFIKSSTIRIWDFNHGKFHEWLIPSIQFLAQAHHRICPKNFPRCHITFDEKMIKIFNPVTEGS